MSSNSFYNTTYELIIHNFYEYRNEIIQNKRRTREIDFGMRPEKIEKFPDDTEDVLRQFSNNKPVYKKETQVYK